MDISDLQKHTMVAVLGFGQEGKAVTEYLLQHGVKPVLFDQKSWDAWPEKDQQYIRSRELGVVFGPQCFKELAGFSVAFRSPGVRLFDTDIQFFVQKGLIITSQTKWFFDHCPAKIIGVTGTKGKGTTSALIYGIMAVNKKPVYLTGNIGKQQPLEFLDRLTNEDWVVYELSSFQLQDLKRSPQVGVVLMVTQEHLDYHKDGEEYVEAKSPLVAFQSSGDFAVVNADYENSVTIGRQGNGKKYYFSRKKELNQGCFVKDGSVVVRDVEGKSFQFSALNFQLKGRHNWENICAATLALICSGVDVEASVPAISSFAGLEHRLELVAEKHGVGYYNDSFSTTPESTIAAVQAFTEPEIIIMGGSSKNADFSPLVDTVTSAPNVKAVIFIGEEGARLKKMLEEKGFAGPKLDGGTTMESVMEQVKFLARSGDVVLLSPACASFGMFKDYKDRGMQFKEAVKKI